VRFSSSLLLVLCAVVSGVEQPDPAPFPDMAPSVGAVLARDYYDQSRFRPRIMVERALRALENAEIIADADWQGKEIALRFADTDIKVPAAEPADLDQAMALIEQIRLAIDNSGKFTTKERRDLAYTLINGALTTLDPHTVMMSPEPAGDFDEDIRGEFGGIGAFLHQDAQSGEITIERVMPDRPAEKAGVQDGDVIVAVNGESTTGLSLEQAVRRIKGPKGTTVTLSLKRKNTILDLSVVRDLVQVVTIRSWRDGDVGYVRMDEFNQNTARDLFNAITELQKVAPLKGLVLDLRANGGGLLDQARVICDFFLIKNKEIVRTVTVGGEPQIFKSSPNLLLDCPMAVLVGPGSASAAAAMRKANVKPCSRAGPRSHSRGSAPGSAKPRDCRRSSPAAATTASTQTSTCRSPASPPAAASYALPAARTRRTCHCAHSAPTAWCIGSSTAASRPHSMRHARSNTTSTNPARRRSQR